MKSNSLLRAPKFIDLSREPVLLHGSDVSRGAQSRRGLSVCYMDSKTKHLTEEGEDYRLLFEGI